MREQREHGHEREQHKLQCGHHKRRDGAHFAWRRAAEKTWQHAAPEGAGPPPSVPARQSPRRRSCVVLAQCARPRGQRRCDLEALQRTGGALDCMGRVTETPALTAEERDWLSWTRSVPASAREAARYREPSFNGARAAPKAEAEARELYDAQQLLTKACAALQTPHAHVRDARTCSVASATRLATGCHERRGRRRQPTQGRRAVVARHGAHG